MGFESGGGGGGLLTDAGFASGDIVYTWGNTAGTSATTDLDIYAPQQLNSYSGFLKWDEHVPDAAQGIVYFIFEADPTTDQLDAKVFNLTDSEDVVEQTGVTASGSVVVGPVQYTPTTTADYITLQVRIRNNDGVTSVSIEDLGYFIGVQL